jgi:hypothetical protein
MRRQTWSLRLDGNSELITRPIKSPDEARIIPDTAK